jgi:multidrug resistance efflux pump
MTETPAGAPAAAQARGATRLAALGLIGLILVLIALHILADRWTPISDQARVHAFIVPVAPEVGGKVEQVFVKNNQRVKKSDPLFALGESAYRIAVEKAQADLSATRRDLAASDEGIRAAKANLDAAKANLVQARQDAERQARIYREDAGAISVRRIELANASRASAEAKVTAAEAQLAQAVQARGDTGPSNDRLLAAQSALDKARLDLSRGTVLAPADGVIADLRIDVGQYAGAGSPIMTFIGDRDAWITADMTENNLGTMTAGAPAEVVFDIRPGKVIKARVRSIGAGVASGAAKAPPGALPDVQNNRDWLRQAQRFPVMVDIDPVSAKGVTLREGAQATVIVYNGKNAILNALGRFYIRVLSLFSYAY